jgi:ferredoxin
MRIVGKRIEITSQCIRCFACRAACPHGAIKLEVPFGMRAIFSRRAEGIDLSKVLR